MTTHSVIIILWLCVPVVHVRTRTRYPARANHIKPSLDWFHALLYEIECHARAKQVKELIHPVLKRGHSNALEASHNVFIRFRSKDISLERLHYHVSTNQFDLHACKVWH